MGGSIRDKRAQAPKSKIAAAVLVCDQDTLSCERCKRLGDPVRSLKVKMHNVKVGGSEQSQELGDIDGRPLGARERVDFDAEFFERIGKRTAAVHHRDFDIEGGAVAMPKHVEQGGLRSAQVEMIDDMKDPYHRESPARKAWTLTLFSCHSRTKRAHSSCAEASFAGFESISAVSSTSRSNSPAAQTPA